MANFKLNTGYVQTNRGVIKILEIIVGIIIVSVLCAQRFGGNGCFNESRLTFNSTLNFVILIINIVLFVINLLNIGSWGLERVYAIVGAVLFLIGAILIGWYIFEYRTYGWLLVSGILVVVQFILFLWDFRILNGESSN